MRIVYAVSGLLTEHPGLQSKILGATKVWSGLGHDVHIVVPSQGMMMDARGGITFRSNGAAFRREKIDYYDRSKSKIRRLISLRHQYGFLRQMLRRTDPDIVYTRYTLPLPGVHRNFSIRSPFIVEINSDDSIEYGIKSRAVGSFNRTFRKSFLARAGGLCFISAEMSQSEAFSWYQGKTTVVSNSIDCAEFPFLEDTGNDDVNLCFIGSPHQSWHGLDKLVTLASSFPLWRFHVIGPDRSELIQAGDTGLENLVCHGYLRGPESRQLVAGMDIGISTLALHRKHMDEASPLKSRQYLAHGVPFISAYADTDITASDFQLQLPNADNNITPNLDRIERFVAQAFRNKDLRYRARRFAEEKLDISVKETERLNFICSVVRQ